MNRSNWVDTPIVAVLLVQLVGYAALSALVPHSEFATVVAPLQRLPPVVLVPVSLVAVPAVLLAVALGAVLAAVGLRPTGAVVLASAYLVSVASLWGYRRISG